MPAGSQGLHEKQAIDAKAAAEINLLARSGNVLITKRRAICIREVTGVRPLGHMMAILVSAMPKRSGQRS
ncbi:hypothetical protein [Hyphomicrobium sp.]|uniref:hypothetical protein n=1 Tax=Hyphomicrobium sp. TaxID=82 RepID=UPI0025BF135D|nr:hypothetical protein [Hyphomicrobium sp.]